MPASKLTFPTTTGTHTGMEGGHLGTAMVGVRLELVVGCVLGAVVVTVTGGVGRLLILVKMNGLAYGKGKKVKIKKKNLT